MPSSDTDRIAVVDMLRAFALLGIMITHAEMAFLAGPPPAPGFDVFDSLDRLSDTMTRVFAVGKFFTIFSFLFGLSFAIQIDRAAQKGVPFAGRFTWRMTLLFAIGFVHNAFFSGDILVIYAVVGLMLLPLQKLSTRWLFVLGVILLLNIPSMLTTAIQNNGPPPTAAQAAVADSARQEFMRIGKQQYEIKRNGTLAELVSMNVNGGLRAKAAFQLRTGRVWMTLGCFLLGMCAGRALLFQKSDQSQRFFRQLAAWSAIPAVFTTAALLTWPTPITMQTTDLLPVTIFRVQQVTLSALYLAIATLVFWSTQHSRLSTMCAHLGRMGLTTYLMQTLFGILVFYGVGLGLLGKVGSAACVGIGIVIFIAQLFIAQWWMNRHTMGPVEWLWRSLTDLRVLQITRHRATAA
jgi:uncharacterized protein